MTAAPVTAAGTAVSVETIRRELADIGRQVGHRHLVTAAEVAALMDRLVVENWWQTAPNPSCRTWCESDHDRGEFNVGGGMTCVKQIDRADWFTVELAQTTSTGSNPRPGHLELNPANIWDHIDRELCDCTPDEVRRYISALSRAADLCEQINAQEDK